MSDLRTSRRIAFRHLGLVRSRRSCPQSMIDFLHAQSKRVPGSTRRPWHYHELHNPWSPAATVFDSWGFLELCQASTLIDDVAELLGSDLILYDTQWLPDPWDAVTELEADAHRCPVEPLDGLKVIIEFAADTDATTRIQYLKGSHKANDVVEAHEEPLGQGNVLFIDTRLRHRLHHSSLHSPLSLAIRYFPATSRYVRAADAAVQRALTQRYPLLNYARLPLWLVHGEDRANNDFVTGFGTHAGFWTQAR